MHVLVRPEPPVCRLCDLWCMHPRACCNACSRSSSSCPTMHACAGEAALPYRPLRFVGAKRSPSQACTAGVVPLTPCGGCSARAPADERRPGSAQL